jgi:AraC-like DNA-binding protein
VHPVDVFDRELRFADEAFGRPYHAALVSKPAVSGVSALHGHADFFEFMAVVSGSGRQLLPDGTHLRAGVPRLCELAAVSAAHLSRSMREHYGTTPTDFVTGLRLQRAAELLDTTSESVTRIAHRCGFSSQSYFTRCFRAAYGVPPREYRRRTWQAFVP